MPLTAGSETRSVRILASSFRFVLLVAAVGVATGWLCKGRVPPADYDVATQVSLASAVASIAGTMLGFLLAALAVLASIAGSRLLRNMQRTGHYQVLLHRLIISAGFFLFLLLAALVTMLGGVKLPWAWEAATGLVVAAIFALVDAMYKFAQVLLALKPETNTLE